MKNFIYLVQGSAQEIADFPDLESEDADVLFLTYDKQVEGCEYFPKSTWTEGRNRLLEVAKNLGNHQYFIFLDADVRFSRGSFKTMEENLSKHQPAVGVPVYHIDHRGWIRLPWLFAFLQKIIPYTRAKYFDALYTAVRRDVAEEGIIRPYVANFDAESWFTATLMELYLMNIFYPRQCFRFSNAKVVNPHHAGNGGEQTGYRDAVRELQTEVLHKKFFLRNAWFWLSCTQFWYSPNMFRLSGCSALYFVWEYLFSGVPSSQVSEEYKNSVKERLDRWRKT